MISKSNRPLISICIPSYNRLEYLSPLLDSILSQDYSDYEILICEDHSPQRSEISSLVTIYQKRFPGLIRYKENDFNFGYDRNIRNLIHHARGIFCLFMGNDDLLCQGALSAISSIILREAECGVVVRSYATFDVDPAQFKQIFRYFPEEVVLLAGERAIKSAYRRSVVIPGMVIHRDSAEDIATDKFDGTLLYQLYLVGVVLASRSVIFTPKIIALRRDGTPPDFGNSEAEKGKFVPQNQTPESSLFFVRGMLNIALFVQEKTGLKVFKGIRKDIGNYSYPILSIQSSQPIKVFLAYGANLWAMGFWRYPLFYFYFIGLVILGVNRLDKLIIFIKTKLGFTPRFGIADFKRK